MIGKGFTGTYICLLARRPYKCRLHASRLFAFLGAMTCCECRNTQNLYKSSRCIMQILGDAHEFPQVAALARRGLAVHLVTGDNWRTARSGRLPAGHPQRLCRVPAGRQGRQDPGALPAHRIRAALLLTRDELIMAMSHLQILHSWLSCSCHSGSCKLLREFLCAA